MDVIWILILLKGNSRLGIQDKCIKIHLLKFGRENPKTIKKVKKHNPNQRQ